MYLCFCFGICYKFVLRWYGVEIYCTGGNGTSNVFYWAVLLNFICWCILLISFGGFWSTKFIYFKWDIAFCGWRSFGEWGKTHIMFICIRSKKFHFNQSINQSICKYCCLLSSFISLLPLFRSFTLIHLMLPWDCFLWAVYIVHEDDTLLFALSCITCGCPDFSDAKTRCF